MKTALIAFAALLAVANAACPNSCSGHGTCSYLDQCTCYAEQVGDTHASWTGADCSQATCPRGVSWNTASGSHGHDTDIECSDAGLCDRSTGECSCFPGYEGSACQRTECPNDCSGHGQCRSNVDFAVDFSEAVKTQQLAEGATITSAYYDYFRVSYEQAWDSGMQYGCLCDQGFRGSDCSLVECPTDQDPMDDELCTKYTAWEGSSSAGANPEDGNTLMASQWDSSTWAFYNPILEYPCNGAPAGDSCSGRGVCDYSTGVCSCFDGFTGTACEEVAQLS